MDVEQAQELVDALDELGYDAEVYEGYSGRGMYGSQVTAITSDSDIRMALAYVAGQTGLDFEEVPQRTDSMGRGVVIY